MAGKQFISSALSFPSAAAALIIPDCYCARELHQHQQLPYLLFDVSRS